MFAAIAKRRVHRLSFAVRTQDESASFRLSGTIAARIGAGCFVK
jgi:hypothetical protein